MLNELVGKDYIYDLMGNAGLELSHACGSRGETAIQEAYTKILAYGMDLELRYQPDMIRGIVKNVIDKMSPETVEKLKDAVAKMEEE